MYDPVRICEILNEEGVRYIVLGGFASVIHGSTLPTRDIDVLPERSGENLERLARALARMHAMIRTEDEPVPALLDAAFLDRSEFMLNLVGDHGEIDLVFRPAGSLEGFGGWQEHMVEVEIAVGVRINIAALDDIIESKRAAGRPKDQAALPYLESLRDELRS
ncbi:MAG: hypothetical protein KGR18_04955 [Acidobacteria bacterium]|nr:hypothetical protein [Acidobacteriota bacterium]